MTARLEKIFNLYSLIAINVGIVALTLTFGGGRYFFDTGLIHVIAIGFIALAISRIFFRHYTYDPILEKFIRATLLAMLIFTFSDILEFTSFIVHHEYTDTVFASVVNFYLIGLFIMMIGAGPFVRFKYPRYTIFLKTVSIGAIVLLSILTALFVSDDIFISLGAYSISPYAYVLIFSLAALCALVEVNKIKKLTPVTHDFANYLIIAIILLTGVAFSYIFHDFLRSSLGIAEYLLIYVSHFIFYATLSVFFLAFGEFANLGGVFQAIKKQKSP